MFVLLHYNKLSPSLPRSCAIRGRLSRKRTVPTIIRFLQILLVPPSKIRLFGEMFGDTKNMKNFGCCKRWHVTPRTTGTDQSIHFPHAQMSNFSLPTQRPPCNFLLAPGLCRLNPQQVQWAG